MQNLPDLTGPSRGPASQGPAKQLVVLLHGVGADGADLIELAPDLSRALPDATFIAPDAPFPCDMAPYGRQWFSLQDRSPAAMAAGVRHAAPILNQFLDRQLAERGLSDEDLVLVGFSQGAMMSLFTALRRPKAAAAVIAYSGALVDEETLGAEIASNPPILLVHGDEDAVVEPGCLYHAAAILNRYNLSVTASMFSGLGHSIDGQAIEAAISFLNDIFNKSS